MVGLPIINKLENTGSWDQNLEGSLPSGFFGVPCRLCKTSKYTSIHDSFNGPTRTITIIMRVPRASTNYQFIIMFSTRILQSIGFFLIDIHRLLYIPTQPNRICSCSACSLARCIHSFLITSHHITSSYQQSSFIHPLCYDLRFLFFFHFLI
jgi:hypothetical protein